jgi:hypothetical protein
MQTQVAKNLRHKLDRRFGQLRSASFGSFPQMLQDFWIFFHNEQALVEINENLTNEFPDIAAKVSTILGSRQNPVCESEEEASALAYEVLRRFSISDSPRGVMHPACFPSEFSWVNCKTQNEIDEKYLKVFKDLYLERFITYVEEQLDDDGETEKIGSPVRNDSQSTLIQNFNAPIASVQTGNSNTAYINQNVGQTFSEILEQLAILKSQFQFLPNEEREEAIEVIDAIEVEIQSETPSKGKLKSFLLATKDFAVKTGTDLAASTLAKLIESQMGVKS